MCEKERIKVYIDYKGGKAVCICKQDRKRCGKNCQKDVVERDRFAEWQSTMKRNRYGK